MDVNAIFKCRERDIEITIQCKSDTKMKEIFEKFAKKVLSNVNDFKFDYKGKPIKGDGTIGELTGNSKSIDINVQKISKILKCPECICNNCIIRIKDYRLFYYKCRYDHSLTNQKFDDYETNQKIDFDKIICDKCSKTQKKTFEDFYKCFQCSAINGATTYLCQECALSCFQRPHNLIKYDQKYYYCHKHYNKYKSYCVKCKTNLCNKCEEKCRTQNHNIKEFEDINKDVQLLKKDLSAIRDRIEDLKTQVDRIIKMINETVNRFEKYCNIAQDIITKYELSHLNYPNLMNFQTIKSISFLVKSNEEVKNDIENIIQGNKTSEDWQKKCKILIDMYFSKIDELLAGSKIEYENIVDEEDDGYEILPTSNGSTKKNHYLNETKAFKDKKKYQ